MEGRERWPFKNQSLTAESGRGRTGRGEGAGSDYSKRSWRGGAQGEGIINKRVWLLKAAGGGGGGVRGTAAL